MSDPLLIEQIRALRELVNERDKLYTERSAANEKAIGAALTAVKEQTRASFDASEKAIVKAEEAQKAYNQSHNDLARKMDEQGKATMPRTETEARFRSLEEKIGEIRGRSQGSAALWGYLVAGIGLLVAIATLAFKLGG